MSVKLTGPDEITAEHLIPGQSVSISFQVENTGTVPAIYNLDMIEVTNNFDPTSDLVYTITSTNNGGHVQDKEAPTENETLIRNILIQPGEENIQEYTLTLLFKETKINQDTNQEKTFEGKVQINNLEDKTMATRIIRMNRLQTEEPDFANMASEEGKGMFASEDDDGTSYYFRGNVKNNTVKFANMTWKILRINGDNSIRLILKDNIGTKSAFNANASDSIKFVGYTFDNEHPCTQEEPCVSDYDINTNRFTSNYGDNNIKDSTIKKILEDWYIQNIVPQGLNDKVALSSYCNDTSIPVTDFGGRTRFSSGNPSLKCPNPIKSNSEDIQTYGGVYKLKIGLITSDEANFLGCVWKGNPGTLFVWTNSWTMSPSSISLKNVFYFGGGGSYDNHDRVTVERVVMPVINLKSDVTFTTDGDGEPGTEDNPYVVQ